MSRSGAATRQSLMRAAEKLIAANGMENVTIRDIMAEAGQKNASALQYHFKNLGGLIEAIHSERIAQTDARRAKLVGALLARTDRPTLREICSMMVRPTFELARKRSDFRRYLKAFGHQLALVENSAVTEAARANVGQSSARQVYGLLQAALPQLSDAALQRRLDAALRLCSVSLHHQAALRGGFQGERGELFINALLDALVGLLAAPESDVTRALSERLERSS